VNAPIRPTFDLPEYPFTEQESERFAEHNRREQNRRELEDFEHLKTMAGKAFRGVYGESAKGAAVQWSRYYAISSDIIDGLQIQHKPALEALRVALRKVPDRTSG
jgi:hypothetical protein